MRRISTQSVIALLLLAGCSGFERVLEEIFPSEPYTVMEGSITDYFEDGIRAIGKQGINRIRRAIIGAELWQDSD